MIFAANWKMNIGPSEARRFAKAFVEAVPLQSRREIWFFPSAVTLTTTVKAFRDRPDIRCGVQDVHWAPDGAFTGAISVALAAASGATLALVGHSERRHLFGESDDETGKKVRAVLEGGLTPLLCVGETLEERERGDTMAVVLRQLEMALAGLEPEQIRRTVVAYEPVWAIGTGRTATPEDAARVHALIRASLVDWGATTPKVLYGGSVKPDNIVSLLAQHELDGVLVGGASLTTATWSSLVAKGVEARLTPQ